LLLYNNELRRFDGKMHLSSQKALALDKLLILLMAVSVVATGIWNMQLRRAASWSATLDGIPDADGLPQAVDDIKYHVQLAGYKLDRDIEPLSVKKGRRSDVIRVCYSDITAEFLVDRRHNLVCRIGENEKILATRISSLRMVRLSPGSVVVTLTVLPSDPGNMEGSEAMSRSYSAAIESPWLL
jgi:hypothetical protein